MKKHGAKKGALLRFLVLTMFVLAFGGCGDRPEGSESVGEHSNLFESDMVTDMADSIESDNTSEMEESKEAASEKNEQSNSTLSEKPDMEATTSPTEESAQKKETTASKVEIVEEGTLTSDKDVLNLLSESKKTTAEEIEFVCTGDLYDNLMDQNTGRIEILMVMSDINGSVFYNDSKHLIRIANVTYTDNDCVECNKESDVKQAVIKHAKDRKSSYYLICSPELAKSFKNTFRLDNFAAQGGAKSVRYYINKNGLIEFTSFEEFDKPYVVVENTTQFSDAIQEYARQHKNAFYVIREQNFYELLKNDSLAESIMTETSMLDKYSCSSNKIGIYEYSNVTYTDEPKMVCYSEDDVVKAVSKMGNQKISSFRIYLVGDLIDQLYANNWERLNQLEAKGGMYDNKMSYSFSDTLRMVYYQEAKIETDVVSLSTVNDAISYIDKKVEAGDVDITLFCSKDLFYFLLKSVKENNIFGDGMDCIYDLICQAGIYDSDLDIFRKIYAIHVHVNKLYPGFEIAQAVKKNKENDLSDKLKRTLDEARKMADSCKTSNKTETAGKIHDAICQRTRYETKSEKSENDTAIGVLLNGRSDCDGYSDAFYLVGTLAGLRIRFQHGDAVNSGFYGFMDSTTHMWNLIELDGTWRLVDLTWDDSDKEISRTWFNLGDDRASRSHIWNREMSVVLLGKTDLTSRPINEFSVTTLEEMEDAVVKALDQRLSRFNLVFDDDSFIAKDETLRFIRQRFNGSISYLWDEDMRLLTIYEED